MFLGHFGIGFGLKRAAPAVSLGTLFLAAQFVDLLWPSLMLVGWESVRIEPGNTVVTPLNFVSYPISHSLLMAVVWGVAVGGLYWLVKKKQRPAVIIAVAVVSHWVLDLIVHRPDLPLLPASEIMAGFGLWDTPVVTYLLEFLFLTAGLWFYLRLTVAKNRTGSIALWALVAFLVVIYLTNILGPPPPSVEMIAVAGHAQWLIVAWGYWLDRNRTVTEALSVKTTV